MSNNKTALINRNSGFYINDDNSINTMTNNILSLSVSSIQTVGIGIEAGNDAMYIKSVTGDCLRLTKNNINSSAFQINDAGELTITNIGTTISNSINILSHNGSSTGLSLAGDLITASANQINRINTTEGVVEASKALIMDSSRNIININDLTSNVIRAQQGIISNTLSAGTLTLTNALPVTSGGTGNALSSDGDILVGDGSNSYSRIPKPLFNGAIFTFESNIVKWSQGLFSKYLELGDFYNIAPTQYVIEYCNAKTNNDLNIITLGSTIVNTAVINNINGFAQSSFLSGTIISPTTTVTGIGSTFLTDFIVGDVLTFFYGDSRRITQITSNTSLTIESVPSSNNLWTLGTGSTITSTATRIATNGLNVTPVVTARATLFVGDKFKSVFNPPTLSNWTIEFWFRITVTTANILIMTTSATNVLRLGYTTTGNFITVSIGQGSSFNILATTNLTGPITANVYVHLAIVFTGSVYNIYKNGIISATVNSTLRLPDSSFNSFIFGSDGTTLANGAYDEIRLSNIQRYTTTFTPVTTAFTLDNNTVSLNHFEDTTSVTSSDDTTRVFEQYRRGGNAPNSVAYIYATSIGYFLSSRGNINQLVDAPVSTDLCRKTGLFLSFLTTIPYFTVKSGNLFSIYPTFTIIASRASSTPLVSQLINIVPINAKMIKVLIIHSHVSATSCGINIGFNATTSVVYLTTATAGITSIITNIPVDTTLSISSNLTVTASTTNYSVILLGIKL